MLGFILPERDGANRWCIAWRDTQGDWQYRQFANLEALEASGYQRAEVQVYTWTDRGWHGVE